MGEVHWQPERCSRERGSAAILAAAAGILPAADGAWMSHRSVDIITRAGRRQDAGSAGLEARAPLLLIVDDPSGVRDPVNRPSFPNSVLERTCWRNSVSRRVTRCATAPQSATAGRANSSPPASPPLPDLTACLVLRGQESGPAFGCCATPKKITPHA